MKYIKTYESFSKPKGMSDEEFEEFSKLMNKTNYAKNKVNVGDRFRKSEIGDITDNDIMLFHTESGIEPEGSSMDGSEQLEMVIDTINDIQNSSDPFTVYRIIIAESKEQINTDSVGIHFTMDESNLDDFRFREDIGLHNNEEKFPLWKLTCKIHKEDIDVYNTVATNLRFPLEKEVMLKHNSDVELIDIDLHE
jgi:hypothetical protein